MTTRSRAQLELWLDDFRDSRPSVTSDMQVLVQDVSEGNDPGLVRIVLVNATTTTVIEPDHNDSAQWVAVFEPREDELRLTCDGVADLANELLVVSELCSYLASRDSE